jgi:signal transduction histidine kinase
VETKDDFFRKLREHFSSGDKKVEISESPATTDSVLPCPICKGNALARPFTSKSGKKVGYKCSKGVVHVAATFRIGSSTTYIVWSGTYSLADDEYAEQLVEVKSSDTHSSQAIEKRCAEIGKQVATLIDDWLSLRAAEAKKRLCNPQEVDRTTLWRRISEEYQQAAWISSVEIFTASAGLDCFTQEWPENTEEGNDINPAQINEEHAKGVTSFRDDSGRHCYILAFNERALAVVRVRHETDEDLDKERIRLEKLSFALADTLDYRRRLRAQENIRQIQMAGMPTADADRSGCLQQALHICRKLLVCDSAELIIRPQQQTVPAPSLMPVFLRDPEVHSDLPWKHPADDRAIVNAINTAKTAFVKRGKPDDLETECNTLSAHYAQDIVNAYRSYRCDTQSTISIPLSFGAEIIAFCSFNRGNSDPFYLGLVHVVELILEYVASYVRDVQLALTNPKHALKEDITSQAGISGSPVNQRERQRLCREMTQTARSRTGATRAAVALFAEKNDELAIVGPRVPSAISNWPDDYFEIRIKPDRTDSAVAAAVKSRNNYLIDDRHEKTVRYFAPERDVRRIISSANILMTVANNNIIGVLIVEWEAANRATLHEPELQRIADEYAYRIHALEVHSRTICIAAALQKVNHRDQLPAALDVCTENLAAMIGPGNYHFYLRDKNTGAFRQVGRPAPPVDNPGSIDEPTQSLLLLLGLRAPASYCVLPRDPYGRSSRRQEEQLVSTKFCDTDSPPGDKTDPDLLLHCEIDKLSSSEAVQGLTKDAMFTPIRLGPHLTADQYTCNSIALMSASSSIPHAAVFGMLISTAANGDGHEDSYDLVDKQAAETVADIVRDRLDLLDEQSLSQAYRSLVDICFGSAVDGNRSANGGDIASKTLDCLQECLGYLGAHIRLIDVNHDGKRVAVCIAYRRPDWLGDTKTTFFQPHLIQPAETDAAGWVYEQKRTFHDPDCSRTDSPCRRIGTPEWFLDSVGSVLVAPLRGRDQVIGTLHIYKSFAYAFSPREIRFISEAVAPLLASAIQNADLLCGNRLREGIRGDVEHLKVGLEELLEQGNEPAVGDQCLRMFFDRTSGTLRKELMVASVFALVADETDLQLWWSAIAEDVASEWVHGMQTRLDLFEKTNITGLRYCFAKNEFIAPIRRWLTSNFPDAYLRKQFSSLCENELSVFFRALTVDGKTIILFFEPANDFPVFSGTVETLVSEYSKRSEEMNEFLKQIRLRLSERRREESNVAPLVMMGAAMSHFEHALRFPLANLNYALMYLADQKNAIEGTKVLKVADTMQAEVSHLESFVDTLLKAARALDETAFTSFSLKDIIFDSLQEHSSVTLVDSPDVAPGCQHLVLHLPDNLTIPMTLSINPVLPAVQGSPQGLTVAFSFLLGNAIDAVRAVREMDPDSCREIRLSADVDTSRVGRILVMIEDDGIGMAPDVANRVDQPFVSNKPTGTGLGLTCAKYIIRRHGCEILIKSNRYPERPSFTAIIFHLPTATRTNF